MSFDVRQASLDDTDAISRLFRARIPVWQRIDAGGRVEDVPYDALTIYERWTHGGPWMSVETCAILLNHLLMGAGIPLVAVAAGEVVGYLEAYHSLEPDPFNSSLHIAHLIAADAEIEAVLIAGLRAQAKALRCQHLTVTRVAGDALYAAYNLRPLARLVRFNIPARQGTVFYRATPHTNADANKISGWYMAAGRFTSARQQWETLMPTHWETLPETRTRNTHRQFFAVAGQEAIMICRQQQYDPRSADIYLWTPKPLSIQVVSAVRDWAHREGYRTLIMAVSEDMAAALGSDAEADGFSQEACALNP